jgi:uroporphyrinogen-III synthase
VLVPRPAGRSDELANRLRAAGADPVLVPLIEIRPESDSTELRTAVTDLAVGAYDWVAFTSAAAVTAVLSVAERIGSTGRPGTARPSADDPLPSAFGPALTAAPAALVGGNTRVAAVGPATARALQQVGIRVDLVPAAAESAAALAAAWPTETPGRTVLLPRSGRAGDTLPNWLRAAGYRVQTVRAYRTVPLPVPEPVAADLAAGGIDAVFVTSPSSASALAATAPPDGLVVIAIGRPTAEAAARRGIAVAAIADRPTAAGLIDALIGVAAGTVTAVGPASPSRRK